MRVYKSAEIRNVAVVGHGASGKTSLVDALAFVAGTSKRHGSVMDKEHANFERVYEQIKDDLTPKVIPVEIPVGEGPDFHGIINLFSQRCHLYKKGTKSGEYEEVDVPAEYRERFERYSKELIERIAETDDTLLERYLGGEQIGRDEAIAAMKAGMARGELYPLFCGAAELTYGTPAR